MKIPCDFLLIFLVSPVIFVLLLLLSTSDVSCQPQKVIKIAAIFEGDTPALETVFRRTIDKINMDKSRLFGARLEGLVAYINHRDSFHASKVGEYFILDNFVFTVQTCFRELNCILMKRFFFSL